MRETKYPRTLSYPKFVNACECFAKHKDISYVEAWNILISRL